MALKRSAGLETVACWQTDAQWTEREVRDQLDALFAHRVYFATASARDARAAVALTMAEFSDTVRPGIERLSSLGRPDVRLHLPKHHAIVSWMHPARDASRRSSRGRSRWRSTWSALALHAARQHERGGRHRSGSAPAALGPRRARDRDARAEPPAKPARADAARRGDRGAGASVADARASGASAVTAESYRELVELDGAHSVRWAKRSIARSALEPEPLDLEMLALIAAMRHVLTSQCTAASIPGAPRRRRSGASSACPTPAWWSASSSIAATAAGSRCAT